MGWFSRSSEKPARPPRWGFTDEWEQFRQALVAEAARWDLELTPKQIASGRVELPDDAAYDYWDLKRLGTRCRDLEPHLRRNEIHDDLVESFGRPATHAEVEVVDEAAPPGAHDANVPIPSGPSPELTNEELLAFVRHATTAAEFARDAVIPSARTQEPPDHAVDPIALRAQIFGATYFSMLDTHAIACRRIGDAWLVLVEETAVGEQTVRRSELAAMNMALDNALELGIAQGARRVGDIRIVELEIPGAQVELWVANGFFLSARALSPAQLGKLGADIRCPITWHHWLVAELDPTADRDTILRLQQLVDELSSGVSVGASERIGTSLWWWPPDSEPIPFTADSLPPVLHSQLRR